MADGAPTAANRTLPLRQPNKALQAKGVPKCFSAMWMVRTS
jgi:hypothetical protein